ncbi:MAG: hypothetical protein AB199_02080 [Parcubacteria bacterium C7867-004]|nr:MAG: hypothetical protein AB199_02080 [Parcubacteria bacterium C7867-004]
MTFKSLPSPDPPLTEGPGHLWGVPMPLTPRGEEGPHYQMPAFKKAKRRKRP